MNLSELRHHVGLLGPHGFVTLVIPTLSIYCGCEHQRGMGSAPLFRENRFLAEGMWSTPGGCATKGPLFSGPH